MTTQTASKNFLVFELLVKHGERFTVMGLFADEPLAEMAMDKMKEKTAGLPVEYFITPRLVEA